MNNVSIFAASALSTVQKTSCGSLNNTAAVMTHGCCGQLCGGEWALPPEAEPVSAVSVPVFLGLEQKSMRSAQMLPQRAPLVLQ